MEVLIFGRGQYCREKYKSIAEKYNVIGMLDNVISNEEYDTEYNLKVYNPNRVKEFENCKVICMSINYFVDMWKQLKELGVADSNILFGVTMEPHIKGPDESNFGNGQTLICNENKLLYKLENGQEYPFATMKEFKDVVRKMCKENNPYIDSIVNLPVKPFSTAFGMEKGRAVDRYYIEKFIEQYQLDIKGTVMEIADNRYTKEFGGDKVDKEIIIHIKGWGCNAIKGNLETGEGLSDNMADCLICTQTLQFIYDIERAAKNIYKILKPGGVALITVPGIKYLSEYDNNNWGEKWSFTEGSMKLSFEKTFGEDNVIVESYGNVKVAVAYLYGLCCEDLSEEDFLYNDKQYPFLITIRVKK